jgi:pimeloyl-ACP methyl ester carboxylesterase
MTTLMDSPQIIETEGGGRVSYRLVGRGRPVLALPGGPGFGAGYLSSFAQGLTESLSWYLIDPPGTGETTDSDSHSVGSLASFYADVAAALGLDSFLLFGHSHGAAVAVTLAMRRPHRTVGCVLVAPPVVGRDADLEAGGRVRAAAGLALARHQGQPWYEEAMRAEFGPGVDTEGGSRRRGLPLYFSKPTVDLIVSAWMTLGTPTMNEQALLRFYQEEWDRFDLRPLLPHLSCPILAVTGEHDWAVPPAQAYHFRELSRNATVVVIPDCGHFPQLEAPEMLRETVTNWLAQRNLMQ